MNVDPDGVGGRRDEDASMKAARLAALRGHVTGLSFSGGGIRSGTFAVGFLQGLASLGLLKRLDYLSTVSGGGYAGAWLAAWLKREGGSPVNVERQLSPSRVAQARADREYLDREVVDEEPQPLRHLRSYSSYMFPRPGLLSVDTWAVVIIWVRNVSINLLLLLSLAMLAVVLARVAVYACSVFNPVEYERDYVFGFPGVLTFVGLGAGALAMFAALRENAYALSWIRRPLPVPTTGGDRRSVDDGAPQAEGIAARVRRWIIVPASVATLLLTIFLRPMVWAIGERIDALALAAPKSAEPTFLTVAWDALVANLGILGPTNFGLHILVLGGLMALGAAGTACRSLRPGGPAFPGQLDRSQHRSASVAAFAAYVFLGLMLLHPALALFQPWRQLTPAWAGDFSLPFVLIMLGLAAAALLAAAIALGERGRKFIGGAAAAGATAGSLLVLLEALIRHFALAGRPDLMATFAPPLTMMVAIAALIVQVAILGRVVDEAEREWWARISAILTLCSLAWVGVMATIIYLPWVFLSSGTIARSVIASGWVATAAAAVLTGRFVLPKTEGTAAIRLTNLASVASQAFLAGMFGAVALVGVMLLNAPGPFDRRVDDLSSFAYYMAGVKGTPLYWMAILFVVTSAVHLVARKLIDVNLFSLNAMYANRLTRCYLGASRPTASWDARWGASRDPRFAVGAPSLSRDVSRSLPPRSANRVTGFDPDDDLDLTQLVIGQIRDDGRPGEVRAYYGPHLLINTTLNLIAGDDLATRDRRGESFVLSPLYCGSKLVGYSKLESPREESVVDPYLTLGRAIAISGAAVDPNMSFYQSAPLTSLLTIFNARLGYWIEKPKPKGWKADSPRFSKLFLQEFFGQTKGGGDFVHLSDGGHYENLGVYELIRRRCRYIILVDAEDDWDASDDNLANLIRLCRIDFGVRIKLDTSPLKAAGPDRLSRSHVVVGEIHYEDVDRGELPGVLVYVKASMTGDEPPDIQKYARKDERFPHQPTDLQQVFDEEQFECYRCLGDHIAREVFQDPAYRIGQDLDGEHDRGMAGGDPETMGHIAYVPRLFSAVQDRWSEPPEDLTGRTEAALRAWSSIRRDLGRHPALAELSRDLYPFLPAPPAGAVTDADRHRAELHTVSRMLHLMEASWLALGLNKNSALSANRGWMNTYRRWTGSKTFRRLWPILRSEASSEFARFCELQFNLIVAIPQAVRIAGPIPSPLPTAADFGPLQDSIQLLADEFEREWPEDSRNGRGILSMIGRAGQLGLDNPPVWIIYQADSSKKMAGNSDQRFPCGIIIGARFGDIPASESDANRPAGEVELFTWVRRPHRSVGLGSRCLTEKLIHDLQADLKASRGMPAPLWARYPLANPVDEDIEYRNFVVFFARYNFKPKYPKGDPKSWGFSLLKRD